MKRLNWLGALGVAMFWSWGSVHADAAAQIDRGRYLVSVSGCNDCHTPGYPESGGTLPESDWLVGSSVGFEGPWGTTYPANLRKLIASQSESEWLRRARSATRPPMPWFSLRDMTESDLKAIYAFVRSLGDKGEPAPDYAPPGQAVLTPYFEFVPKGPGEHRQAAR
ncbi:MAG: cytochrome C [Bdellovibrio bacteriovorus]